MAACASAHARVHACRDEEMRILRGEQEVDEAALNFDDDEAEDDDLFSDEDAAVREGRRRRRACCMLHACGSGAWQQVAVKGREGTGRWLEEKAMQACAGPARCISMHTYMHFVCMDRRGALCKCY